MSRRSSATPFRRLVSLGVRWGEILILVVFLQSRIVVSWNYPNHRPTTPPLPLPSSLSSSSSSSPPSFSNRRQWITRTALVALTTTTTTITIPTKAVNAACLQGDLRSECIGVYKVPLDDRILPYVSTPESLQRFAPDLHWVAPIAPPQTLARAWELLETQRLAAATDIYQVVQQGRLEEAGIKILNLLPIVTITSNMILEDALLRLAQLKRDTVELSNSSSSTDSAITTLASNRLENQCALALGLWGETDIMVGQGIKGDLGVSAVAQIQILNQLKEATAALDDFMASAASVTGRKLSIP